MLKRKQQKLILTDDERSMIKGLIVHTEFNDQMIVSIFSHLSRTINHREIGAFRDKKNEKYAKVKTATKPQVDDFIAKYSAIERVAKELGALPQEEYFKNLQKACESFQTAVSCFNNPTIRWKSEIFIVNAVIAWTYLMHAFYMRKKISFEYKKDGTVLVTEEGRPKFWELSRCISVPECPLPKPVKDNLRYIIAIRNEIEHRLSENIDAHVAPKLQACALNFNFWLCEWFGRQYSIAKDLSFAIQFSEFSLQKNADIVGSNNLPQVVQTVNALVEQQMDQETYNDHRYSYRVYVIPRTVNNKSKADQMVTFADVGSTIEMAIREVERPKYTASQIVKKMKKEGFSDFSLQKKGGFVYFWKTMNAKDPNKQLGVQVAGTWFWYEKMIDETRKHLAKIKSEKSS